MSKTIIVLVDEESDGYDEQSKTFFGQSKVITMPIGEDGAMLRGYSADVILMPEDTSQDIRNRIISPMIAVTDGEVFEY